MTRHAAANAGPSLSYHTRPSPTLDTPRARPIPCRHSEGGFFKATLKFPEDFPNSPPEMRFVSDIWHPNIYTDGKVCISILHPPGVDVHNQQESADERWRPILGVEGVLVSVMSMLSAPNADSPANIDAAKMFREDLPTFRRRVRRCVEKSLE